MKTTAEHRDGKVRFNGTKTLITNAVDTKYLLTMAVNPDAEDPRRAISMYLVPTDAPGIEISPISKMCWHTADSSEIYYNDVEVDESCLVGVKGEGFKQLMKNFELERIMLGIRLREGIELASLGNRPDCPSTERPDAGRATPPHLVPVVAGLVGDGLLDAGAALRGRAVLTLRGRLMADTVTRALTR